MPSARAYITPYINGALLKEAPIVAPIDRVESQEIDSKPRLVLFVAGQDKGLPLNVTNTNTLCDKLGDNYDDWTGATIELYADRCQFKGKTVDCVRLRFPINE